MGATVTTLFYISSIVWPPDTFLIQKVGRTCCILYLFDFLFYFRNVTSWKTNNNGQYRNPEGIAKDKNENEDENKGFYIHPSIHTFVLN